MSPKQEAALWWRQLFTELGSNAVTRTAGHLGYLSKRRAGALVNLFFSVIAEAPTRCLIEVGAHNAESSKRFVASNPEARAVAYEATPSVYEKTLAGGIPDRMQMVNCAIGAHNGNAIFYVPEEERLLVWASTRRRAGNVKVREITVPMITLDEAIRRAASGGDQARDTALWIDVEGAALDVLAGGRTALARRISAVFVEVNDFSTYSGSETSLEILELLLSCGFIPVGRDNQYADAWNLLAVHEDVFHQARSTIMKWTYAHSGFVTLSNWLAEGKE